MSSDLGSHRATFGNRKRILVIDDEPEVTRLVLRILKQNGFDGWAVHDPLSITARIAEIRPDVILLDFDLGRVTGPEAAAELKRNAATCRIPIIFLSGMADKDHREIGGLSGGADYLTKPVDQAELLEAIRKVTAPSAE